MKYPTQPQQECEIGQRLYATFHARCDRCSASADLKAIETEDAATGFYETGWRVVAIDDHDPVSDQLLCPNCVEVDDAA